MNQLTRILIVSALLSAPAFARVRFWGWCEKGGPVLSTTPITVAIGLGNPPSTPPVVVGTIAGSLSAPINVQQSFPGATVTVYTTGGATGFVSTSGTTVTFVSGTLFNPNGQWNGTPITINSVIYTISSVAAGGQTLTLTSSAGTQLGVAYSMNGSAGAGAPAAIYSDNNGTPLANPFSCVSGLSLLSSYYDFYADNSTVDLRFSGTGIGTPFTLAAVSGTDPLTTIPSWIVYNATIGTAAQQCTSAVNSHISLLVSTVMPQLPSQTMNCSLVVIPGGQLQSASGAVVTLAGGSSFFCVADHQCFDISLGGVSSFLFTTLPTSGVSPLWWGAKCDGSTNDTTAFLGAVKGMKSAADQTNLTGQAGTMILPPATCILQSTVTFYGMQYGKIWGSGGVSILKRGAGNSSTPILLFSGTYGMDVRNFTVLADAANPTTDAIELADATGPLQVSRSALFTNVIVDGAGTGLTDACWIADGTDGNNDFHVWNKSICQNLTNGSGWYLKGSQSYSHEFHDSQALFVKWGVTASPSGGVGSGGGGASFLWSGGGSSSTACGFRIDGHTDQAIVVDGADSEELGLAFCVTNKDVGSIVWKNSRWVRDPASTSTNHNFIEAQSGDWNISDVYVSSTEASLGNDLRISYGERGSRVNQAKIMSFTNVNIRTVNNTLATLFSPSANNPLLFVSWSNFYAIDPAGISNAKPYNGLTSYSPIPDRIVLVNSTTVDASTGSYFLLQPTAPTTVTAINNCSVNQRVTLAVQNNGGTITFNQTGNLLFSGSSSQLASDLSAWSWICGANTIGGQAVLDRAN